MVNYLCQKIEIAIIVQFFYHNIEVIDNLMSPKL